MPMALAGRFSKGWEKGGPWSETWSGFATNFDARTHPPLYLHHLQRWCNVKHIVGLPLLDPSLPDEGVAAWIDEHTMAIHS